MKTSCIRHPDDNVFVIRRDWQLKALETGRIGKVKPKRNNTTECAAEILSVLEYHYNNRQANRMYRDILAKVAHYGKRDLAELGDWLPYSLSYIQELLLNGRSIGLIAKSLELLLERKFISDQLPEDLGEKYGTSNRWFKLEVTYINEWIDNNIPKMWQDGWKKSRKKMRTMPESEAKESSVDIDTKTKTENTIFKFYKHIHGKNEKFVFDSDRRTKVKARMKESGRTIGMAAQAIIGNIASDFHQARHKENLLEDGGKIYDDIELIFRNAKNFEKHLGYAEDIGVTEEIAMVELEAFLSGKPSRYAKKPPKPPQNAPDQAESAPKARPNNAKQYREFAINVASFFATGVDNKEIAEFCITNESLKSLGDGLVDSRFLVENIAGAITTFRPSGASVEMLAQINEFASNFCQIQTLNSEDDNEPKNNGA